MNLEPPLDFQLADGLHDPKTGMELGPMHFRAFSASDSRTGLSAAGIAGEI